MSLLWRSSFDRFGRIFYVVLVILSNRPVLFVFALPCYYLATKCVNVMVTTGVSKFISFIIHFWRHCV